MGEAEFAVLVFCRQERYLVVLVVFHVPFPVLDTQVKRLPDLSSYLLVFSFVELDADEREGIQATAYPPVEARPFERVGGESFFRFGIRFGSGVFLAYPLSFGIVPDGYDAVLVVTCMFPFPIHRADYLVEYGHVATCVLVREYRGVSLLGDGLYPEVYFLRLKWAVEL